MDKTVAFIPLRGGSRSIRNKNIKEMNGRPMVYWVLDAASECLAIDRIYVSTDSDVIREAVEKYGNKKITVIDRSPETATDYASTESAMLEFAENAAFETIVLIQATSPLLTSEYICQGIDKMEHYDGVLSVVKQKRFVWSDGEDSAAPVNYDYTRRPPRQNFAGFYVENGAFYITTRERLLQTGCRLSGRIGLVAMPEESYFEVDEPSDWIIVEQMLRKQNRSRNPECRIKALFTDCDGVLTDNGMYYTEYGDEIKKFNTRDGFGLRALRDAGVITGIITGENRELVRRRAEKLNMDELHMGIRDKLQVIHELMQKYNLSYSEIAYIGDDINDLEVIRKVGLGCCVADAFITVRETANFTTRAKGGEGALREVAEYILDKYYR